MGVCGRGIPRSGRADEQLMKGLDAVVGAGCQTSSLLCVTAFRSAGSPAASASSNPPRRLHPVPFHAPLRSLKTFGRMRDEMVFAALRCKRPKWLVFWDLMRGKRFVEEELFYAPDEVRLGAFCMLRGLRVCATGELFHAPGEARLRALGGRPFES